MDFKLALIIVFAIGTAIGVWLLFRFLKLKRQVDYMFEAVDNGDFAFRYPTHGLMQTGSSINETLNRVISTLGRMADRLRQRDQYFEILLGCVDTGILVVDQKGFVVQSNEAACRLLHRDVITHIDQVSGIDKSHFAIGETPVTLRGEQLRILAIKDIRQQLDQKEQESWERITHVLTHEIMNSVTPITSLSDSLIENCPTSDATLRQGLATISRTGHGLMDFVEHYRQYANVPKPNPSLFYLKPFLLQMQQLALHQLDGTIDETQPQPQKVEITLSVEPDDIILHADESLIGRVVINLLRNAVQAFDGSQPHPQINIRARLNKKEETIIDITNNGPAIDADLAEQIFIPFFTTRPDGSGIGLPLSRRIMRASGGDLTLISDPKHHLTTFRLLFP